MGRSDQGQDQDRIWALGISGQNISVTGLKTHTVATLLPSKFGFVLWLFGFCVFPLVVGLPRES